MVKGNNNFLRSKWMKWAVIPFMLFTVWVIFTSWYIVKFDQTFLILSYNHHINDFTQVSHDRLLKGEKLAGEFTGQANNLGIVALRFKSFQRIPYRQEDKLVFRIKEKGEKKWYYENKYRSGFVYDIPFLPFGFPPISDSQGKKYEFELESMSGNQINGVALSSRKPFIASKYQADKTSLQNDFYALINFGLKKFFNSFDTIDIAFSSFVFALPLLLYLFWLSPVRKKLVDPALYGLKKQIDKYCIKNFGDKYAYVQKGGEFFVLNYLLFILFLIVLIDIIVLQIYNDFLYLIIGILWFVFVKAYKLDGVVSICVGILILIFSPLYLHLNVTNIAEKAGAWAFIFFVAGVFQFILDFKNNKQTEIKAK